MSSYTAGNADLFAATSTKFKRLPEKNMSNKTFCAVFKVCLSAVHCQSTGTFPASIREVCLGVVLLNSLVNDFDLALEVICKT